MSEAYERPNSLDTTLGLLAQGDWTVIAGGTDVYPTATDAYAWGREEPQRLLDITDVDELSGIESRTDGHWIGSRVTWSDITRASLPSYFDGLRLAAKEVGGISTSIYFTPGKVFKIISPKVPNPPPISKTVLISEKSLKFFK